MDAGSTIRLHTGREMPVIGLGTWQLDERTAETIVEAIDLGYRLIDTSGDYGTQPGVGEAVARAIADRDDLFLVTKVEEHEDTHASAHAQVRELGVERADLVLVHRPPPRGAGIDLWEGLVRAKEDGVAADIGVSNYTIEQIDELVDATGEMPVVNQIEWTPFGWSSAMLDGCRERGIVIQAYSPLTRTQRLADPRLVAIAERCGRTPAQVLLRWNLQHGVVPLPKANRSAHLVENLDVFGFELSDEDVDALDAMNEHASSLGSLPYV